MSLKRIGLKLAMLATVLNMCLSPVILHASCRTAVFVPGNVQGSCACASGSCESPSQQTFIDRWKCGDAPCGLGGREVCNSSPQVISSGVPCYTDFDYWAVTGCASTLAGCSVAIAGCVSVCSAQVGSTCWLCLAGYYTCQGAMAAACAQPCGLQKCFLIQTEMHTQLEKCIPDCREATAMDPATNK